MGNNTKTVAVGLSGGVDSALTAWTLQQKGYNVVGITMALWDGSIDMPIVEGRSGCFGPNEGESIEAAESVAKRLSIPFHVVPVVEEYKKNVLDYFRAEYRAGRTPNPCVRCNQSIKFGAMLHAVRKMGVDFDYFATGHYATTEEEEISETVNGQLSNRKLKWLCTSPDPVKDQTDFLAQIYDWQLEKALFPIGHMMKEEVREIAEREHLVNAKRKDSQGICFLGKINYNDYLRRYLGELPGDVIELETGKKIGKHKGHWFHTIGQRKGMGLGGGPWFVIKKDIEQNIIYVSHGYDPADAYTQDFPIHDFHSINGVLPPTDITLKIRHTPEYLPAKLEPMGEGRYMVHAEAPIHGVAPGQFCVVYDNRHHRCYGSGEITTSL